MQQSCEVIKSCILTFIRSSHARYTTNPWHITHVLFKNGNDILIFSMYVKLFMITQMNNVYSPMDFFMHWLNTVMHVVSVLFIYMYIYLLTVFGEMWIVPNLDKRISVNIFYFLSFSWGSTVDTCTVYFRYVLYRYLQFGALSTTDKDPLTVTIQSIQRDLNSIIQSQSSEGLTHQVNYHHLHHPSFSPSILGPCGQ